MLLQTDKFIYCWMFVEKSVLPPNFESGSSIMGNESGIGFWDSVHCPKGNRFSAI